MRKLTFDTLPGAVAEILERLDRVEQLLNGKTQPRAKTKKLETKSAEESMDIKEAATMLNVTVASVYSYVKNKRIPFEKQGGKLAFSRTALEAWKQEKNTGKRNTGKKSTGKKNTGNKEISSTPGELITPQEAQKIFNKPLPSIYYLIRTRKLQVVEKKGRMLYYSKNELSKALKGKQKKSKEKPE